MVGLEEGAALLTSTVSGRMCTRRGRCPEATATSCSRAPSPPPPPRPRHRPTSSAPSSPSCAPCAPASAPRPSPHAHERSCAPGSACAVVAGAAFFQTRRAPRATAISPVGARGEVSAATAPLASGHDHVPLSRRDSADAAANGHAGSREGRASAICAGSHDRGSHDHGSLDHGGHDRDPCCGRTFCDAAATLARNREVWGGGGGGGGEAQALAFWCGAPALTKSFVMTLLVAIGCQFNLQTIFYAVSLDAVRLRKK